MNTNRDSNSTNNRNAESSNTQLRNYENSTKRKTRPEKGEVKPPVTTD